MGKVTGAGMRLGKGLPQGEKMIPGGPAGKKTPTTGKIGGTGNKAAPTNYRKGGR